MALASPGPSFLGGAAERDKPRLSFDAVAVGNAATWAVLSLGHALNRSIVLALLENPHRTAAGGNPTVGLGRAGLLCERDVLFLAPKQLAAGFGAL